MGVRTPPKSLDNISWAQVWGGGFDEDGESDDLRFHLEMRFYDSRSREEGKWGDRTELNPGAGEDP